MYSPEMRINRKPVSAWRNPSAVSLEPNWQMVDLNIERLLDLGIKPMYTTCFTPPGFTDSTATCWPDSNPVGMPRDLNQWSAFVTHGLEHHVRRFGIEEMRSWWFECWNEPNLSGFFAGSKEDFFRLWSATWHAVKAVDPHFRFGGPSTARGEWIEEFLDWTQQDGTPPDYLISHVYNNDSDSQPLSPFDGPASHRVKDSPHFASGVIRGVKTELERRGWKGEIHWNEWGRSWFPCDQRRESGLESAFIVKTMAEVSQCADAFAFWCLSDIYDQIGFQSSEFEGHYGLLSLHGLRKPGWFAHVLLNRLGDRRFPVQGGNELANALVTETDGRAAVLVYSYPSSPEEPVTLVSVAVKLNAPHHPVKLTLLDAEHNNIIHIWKSMGSPASPTRSELETLSRANDLQDRTLHSDHEGLVRFEMQTPGVALLEYTV